MDVRTFEAFSMKDAVKSVKKALGVDAVILSTREKAGPNGKGTIYEVTAATQGQSSRAGARATHNQTAINAPDAALDARIEAIGARLNSLGELSATKNQVQAIESGMRELKLLLLENLRGKDGSVLKDLAPALVPIDRQLRVMGVDDISIAELMKHLAALPAPEPTKTEGQDVTAAYREQAIRWMMKRIRIAPRWTIMPGAVSWQAVVGTTGVGKSSVVAKLAAIYSKREKQKVAVVSLDNRRLAAAEQMRIFCKIIGVPFITAATAQELAAVPETHKDVELILIDTAGIGTKNLEPITQLEEARDAGVPIDFHLCLSVTEKEPQMDQAIRAFSRVGLQSLVFSKLDESWSYGEIYNLSRKWALPLSFFSIGQAIPDDLERATRERVIERIFGL